MTSNPTTPANELYLVIPIDTECDHDKNWARFHPLRYKSVTVGIPDIPFHGSDSQSIPLSADGRRCQTSSITDDLYEALKWCKNEGIKFSSTRDSYSTSRPNH
jgi:hypothetical protein